MIKKSKYVSEYVFRERDVTYHIRHRGFLGQTQSPPLKAFCFVVPNLVGEKRSHLYLTISLYSELHFNKTCDGPSLLTSITIIITLNFYIITKNFGSISSKIQSHPNVITQVLARISLRINIQRPTQYILILRLDFAYLSTPNFIL